MYSAYKLNKQGDSIQPWHTPFQIWNQSVIPCPVLTVAYWRAHRFLRRQIRWSGIPISLRIFHSLLWSTQVKGFGIVNNAEVDVFGEFSCFVNDPTDVGNVISGSSAFSKSNLNILKFKVHALLKPDLENLEHYIASMWGESNCALWWKRGLAVICCKGQGHWVSSVSPGPFEGGHYYLHYLHHTLDSVVKQEMARVNIDILGISELKCYFD